LEGRIGSLGTHVHLNSILVARAVDNAIRDLERMSEFHMDPGKEPDHHKIAGFLSRWVAKERPIQINDNLPLSQLSERLQWLNATYAVFVMNSFLKRQVTGVLAYHLRYGFAFRDERGETLALLAYCGERMEA